eukprot:TRINITY_DN2589_c0_g3_i1.p1 TRINITY_DN2589_c0_g3~~TRINITY_DN2589_c0_g3_i1.p1  ORF type:complete len:486 (+),score=53.24 TRINITY_DN2589_c0_g3_i1:117-1574(+)
MEEFDVELLSYLVEADSWEPSVIAKIACLSKGLADIARTVLWPRYCKHRFPEVTESVIESLTRAIPESVIAIAPVTLNDEPSADLASENVSGKPAEPLPATSLATSADSSVGPSPEGGWGRLAFFFSACAAPPTHLSLEGEFTTEYAREIFVRPDGDVIWAAKCMHAPNAPFDDGYWTDDEESLSEDAAHGGDMFRGLIINFQASRIYKELSVSNPSLFPAAPTPERSTPLPPDRTADIASEGACQQNERETREESHAPSDCPSSSALHSPGLSAVTMALPTREGQNEEEDIRDSSHWQKEEDHGNNVQGSHIQAPISSLPPYLPPVSSLSQTSTGTSTTLAAPHAATTTIPSCSRPSAGTTQSVPVEDLKLEGGSTSAHSVERVLAMLEIALARGVECETMSRCTYCNSLEVDIASSPNDTKLELSHDIIRLYICTKGHFYGKLRTEPDGGEDVYMAGFDDHDDYEMWNDQYDDEDFLEENDFL